MSESLKAYEVREPNEGECVVVFATKNVVARREGAQELQCEFEDVESCTRRPEFDQYTPGPVPLHALLAAGWWHTCAGCGCEFDADGLRGHEDGPKRAIEPMQDSKGHAYCSHGCMMEDWQARQVRKAREHAAIELALTKWPQAIAVWPVKSGCGAGFDPDACSVRLPGLQNPVSWVFGAATAGVVQIDVPEFQRLYGVQEVAA